MRSAIQYESFPQPRFGKFERDIAALEVDSFVVEQPPRRLKKYVLSFLLAGGFNLNLEFRRTRGPP